jgi:hypothetical protein
MGTAFYFTVGLIATRLIRRIDHKVIDLKDQSSKMINPKAFVENIRPKDILASANYP